MAAFIHKLPSLAHAKWLQEPRLQKVLAVLNTGGETRVAGGAVRNALMKLPVTEIDLATTLTPQDVMQLAKGAGFGVHPTGIDHGTVTVVCRAAAFEVTTLRRDVKTDGRHAVVSFTSDFALDAQRRDFTMNSLYCDAQGKICDFTNGYGDIRKRKVKFVGTPSRRIAEDYLRILRFFRFHAAYGRGAPDKAGLAASARLRKGLKKISSERIRQEFLKLLVGPLAVQTLQAMARSKVLDEVLACTHDWQVVKHLPPDPILRLFALANEPLALKERLRLSNADAARIEALASAPALSPRLREREQRALLYRLGPQGWRDAVALSRAKARGAENEARWRKMARLPDRWAVPQQPLTGKDLLSRGHQPGPKLGEALQWAEDYWMASDFKASKEQLLAQAEGLLA